MGIEKKIYIIGAGGHAKVLGDIILKLESGSENRIKLEGFFDDNKKGNIFDRPILGRIEEIKKLEKYKHIYFIIGIGDNKIREEIKKRYPNLSYYTTIHPTAIIGNNVSIGEGTVVMAGSIINCYTRIGEQSIINTGSIIEHDNDIGDYVHICPSVSLAGGVTIGSKSWVGIGTIVKQGIKIGENTCLGAGSLVLKDISDNILAYGQPCVVKREKDV